MMSNVVRSNSRYRCTLGGRRSGFLSVVILRACLVDVVEWEEERAEQTGDTAILGRRQDGRRRERPFSGVRLGWPKHTQSSVSLGVIYCPMRSKKIRADRAHAALAGSFAGMVHTGISLTCFRLHGTIQQLQGLCTRWLPKSGQ